LQIGDVVTSERGRGVVQQPVTEVVAGLDQRTPRLGTADAVDAEASAFLERPDGSLGRGPVGALVVGSALVAGGAQA